MVTIRTSRGTFTLRRETLSQLAERLDNFGAPDAAKRLRSNQSILPEDAPVAREVLGRWLKTLNDEQTASELNRARAQLGRDLHPNPDNHKPLADKHAIRDLAPLGRNAR